MGGRFADLVAAEFVAGDLILGRKTKQKTAYEAGTAAYDML